MLSMTQPFGVTLSAAKGLSRWAVSCFAELTLSGANVLSMTLLSCCRCYPFDVTLSAAKGLSLGIRETSKRTSDMIEAWEEDITIALFVIHLRKVDLGEQVKSR